MKKDNRVENHFLGEGLIDGLVIIDAGDYLGHIEARIAQLNPQDPEAIFDALTRIPKELLKDAITANKQGNTSPAVLLALSNRPAALSEIVKGGYGMCRHYMCLSLLVAQRLGVTFVLAGNARYMHTFGFANIGGQWRTIDPFAEVFYANNGKPGEIFPRDCYLPAQATVFATNVVKS